MFETGMDDQRVLSGRRLREELMWNPAGSLIVALTPGGATVARGIVENVEAEVRLVGGFGEVAALGPLDERTILLVDDGEESPEVLAAAAWALRSLGSGELTVAVPVASRYLEVVLPPRTYVVASSRYTPVRDDGRMVPSDPPAERTRRYPKPLRAGRPWNPAEEERLGTLVNEGRSSREIAEALGRSRGGVESRIARIAILRGLPPPPDRTDEVGRTIS